MAMAGLFAWCARVRCPQAGQGRTVIPVSRSRDVLEVLTRTRSEANPTMGSRTIDRLGDLTFGRGCAVGLQLASRPVLLQTPKQGEEFGRAQPVFHVGEELA